MKADVLVIDDDPIDIGPMRMLLEDWGMSVHTASSGEEGLSYLKEHVVDLLITDVYMPGIKGHEVLKRALEACPGLPIVLVTGQADIKSAVDAMKEGALDYVTKPPNQEELRLILERALEVGRLRRENAQMRAELGAGGRYGERLMGRSPAMQEVFALIEKVARTDSTVLISGETGTGKELVAQTIHYKSPRAGKALVAFNSASLNPNLVESELFGHEKGAFTGAAARRRGRFEEADGGTLFLDEIGEMSLDCQSKLLRVLQENELQRVGGSERIPVNVRLIAATNRNLEGEVKEGRFREDLFYRLRVIPIEVPPLRERVEDIELLATAFLEETTKQYGVDVKRFAPSALKQLKKMPWKGNVRELQHAVERAVVLADTPELQPKDFEMVQVQPPGPGDEQELQSVLNRATRDHLVDVLDQVGWHKQRAATILGIDRVTLYRMLKKFSLDGGK